jgi:hypothetical protein
LQLQQNAQQTIESMKYSLKLLLAHIQKFTSHTLQVFLRDLIPGARAGRSLLFTQIVEYRNHYLAATRFKQNTTKPYSALDTLQFIEASYVQTNENSVHISYPCICGKLLLQPCICGKLPSTPSRESMSNLKPLV